MSEPNPPSQPKANGPGDPAGSSPVQFNSKTSAKANQPKDYFAEQNKKRAEKKQKAKKIHKIAILISAIAMLVLIVLIVVLVSSHSGPVVDDDEQGGNGSELSAVQNLNEQVEEVFEPSFSVGEDGNLVMNGDFEAVEQMYAAALDNPANAGRIDTIYLAQMTFYSSFGDTERVVEIAQKVEPKKLNSVEKASFYNLAYLAYNALGDTLHAEYYNKLMREAGSKIEEIGG